MALKRESKLVELRLDRGSKPVELVLVLVELALGRTSKPVELVLDRDSTSVEQVLDRLSISDLKKFTLKT